MPDFTSSLDEMNGVPTADDVYGEFDLPVPPPRKPDVSVELKDAIVKAEDGSMSFRGFQLTATGLVVAGDVADEDWVELGKILSALQGRLQWLIGDWAATIERQWKRKYKDIADYLGYEEKTIRDWVYVCRNVELSMRIDNVSFAHHQLVASMTPDDQLMWLRWVVDNKDVSTREMAAAIKTWKRQDNPSLSQKPPALFAPEQLALLRDVRNVLKNERKLANTSAAALRASAQELAQIVQKMYELADTKDGKR